MNTLPTPAILPASRFLKPFFVETSEWNRLNRWFSYFLWKYEETHISERTQQAALAIILRRANETGSQAVFGSADATWDQIHVFVEKFTDRGLYYAYTVGACDGDPIITQVEPTPSLRGKPFGIKRHWVLCDPTKALTLTPAIAPATS